MGKPFKLANGLLLLSTEAPGGIYNATQLKKIASLCDGDSSVVKATEDQRLAIFVASDKAAKIAAELKAVGLGVRHYQDGLHQPVNCLGEMCPEHLQDAMATSMELTKELSGITLGTTLKIGINGCARSCVATHTLDISIIGDTNGYRVSLGGKNSQLPEMASFMAEGVPAAKLPKLIAKVVSVYKELAQKNETLQELTERIGSKEFIDALAPYSQDAHQDDPFSGIDEDSAATAPAHSGPEIDADFGDTPTAEPNFEDAEFSSDDSNLQVMADDEAESMTESADTELLMTDEEDSSAEMPTEEVFTEATPTEETVDASDLELTMAETPSEDLSMEMDATPAADGNDLAFDDLNLEESLASDAPQIDSKDLAEVPTEIEDLTFDEPVAVTEPAPAPAPPLAAESLSEMDMNGEDLSADEVSDADADAFEEKLNASIAEEETYPELEDANSLDRLEAMKLIEEGGEIEVDESLSTDGSFENLGIDHDEEVIEDDAVDNVMTMPSANSSEAAFEFVGFDLSGDRISLNFSSGAAVAIDPNTITPGSHRDLMVAGKKIRIHRAEAGLEVEVDGVTIFLPKRAA